MYACAFPPLFVPVSRACYHRALCTSIVNSRLKKERRCLYVRTLVHWARQAKVVKYERSEEARLAALANRAAMDEQIFSLRAEVAALMRDKEDATLSLENLRSSSKPVHYADVRERNSPAQSGPSIDDGTREAERVTALEARLKQADEHIHQLVTHGGTQ